MSVLVDGDTDILARELTHSGMTVACELRDCRKGMDGDDVLRMSLHIYKYLN
jgi:hypothetical protein